MSDAPQAAVFGDALVRFQAFIPRIDLTFNQYLVGGEHPLLVHTGDDRMARQLVGPLGAALGGRPLAYIFISHFESDECGGLAFLLERYPGAVPVCSEVTARQLEGFGITRSALVKKPGEMLETESFSLRFVGYPSEMHLWEGLLAFEVRRKVLFGADLFIQFGRGSAASRPLDWKKEIEAIGAAQCPSQDARRTLQDALRELPVELVAPGHGSMMGRA